MDWFLYDNGLRHERAKSLKINKAPGFDQIDVDVINQIYNHIKKNPY